MLPSSAGGRTLSTIRRCFLSVVIRFMQAASPARCPPLSLLHQRTDGSVRDVACWAEQSGCRKGPPLAPVGMAVSPDQKNLYVASQVEDAHEHSTMERLSAFSRDRATGMVVPLPGRSACVSMSYDNFKGGCALGRGFGSPSDVVVSGDGHNVYLAGSGGVAAFSRAADGSLRQLAGEDGCVSVALRAAPVVRTIHMSRTTTQRLSRADATEQSSSSLLSIGPGTAIPRFSRCSDADASGLFRVTMGMGDASVPQRRATASVASSTRLPVNATTRSRSVPTAETSMSRRSPRC